MTFNFQKYNRRKYDIGERLWIRPRGERYELLAEVTGFDRFIHVEVVDEQTTIDVPYPGYPVWKVWRSNSGKGGIKMDSRHFKIVRRA